MYLYVIVYSHSRLRLCVNICKSGMCVRMYAHIYLCVGANVHTISRRNIKGHAQVCVRIHMDLTIQSRAMDLTIQSRSMSLSHGIITTHNSTFMYVCRK
jgi:hypothetical protein